MNGQHLRELPSEELTRVIGDRWKVMGILKESEGPFADVSLVLFFLPNILTLNPEDNSRVGILDITYTTSVL